MKVKEIMNTDLKWVTPDTDLQKTAEIMEKYDVGVVPVCNHNQVLLGLITDRDIVIRNIARGENPDSTKVEEIMTEVVKTGTPNMSLDEACDVMATWQIRRLPIVENDKLVGIVSLGDIAFDPESDMEVSDCLCEICQHREDEEDDDFDEYEEADGEEDGE